MFSQNGSFLFKTVQTQSKLICLADSITFVINQLTIRQTVDNIKQKKGCLLQRSSQYEQ